jgi:capsule polysaccharide export protein KpsE/RkpR
MITFKKRGRIGKKGVSIWISWVLIIAFMSIIASVMFVWTSGFTSQSTQRLKDVYNAVDCNFVTVSIDGACQNTQTLNMNITNRKNIDIDELVLRIYDIYGNPETKEMSVFIRHGRTNTETVKVIKQGVTSVVEVVPVVIKDNKRIICDERKITANNINFC